MKTIIFGDKEVILKEKEGVYYIKCGKKEGIMAIILKNIRLEECYKIYRISDCINIIGNEDMRILLYRYKELNYKFIESENIEIVKNKKIICPPTKNYNFIIDYPIPFIRNYSIDIKNIINQSEMIKIDKTSYLQMISSDIQDLIDDKKQEYIEKMTENIRILIKKSKIEENNIKLDVEDIKNIVESLKDKIKNKVDLIMKCIISAKFCGIEYKDINEIINIGEEYEMLEDDWKLVYDGINYIYSETKIIIDENKNTVDEKEKICDKIKLIGEKTKGYYLMNELKNNDIILYHKIINKNKVNEEIEIEIEDKSFDNSSFENLEINKKKVYINKFIIKVKDKYYEIIYDEYGRKKIEVIINIKEKLNNDEYDEEIKNIKKYNGLSMIRNDKNNYNMYSDINTNKNYNKEKYKKVFDYINNLLDNDLINMNYWISYIIQNPHIKQNKHLIIKTDDKKNADNIILIFKSLFGYYMEEIEDLKYIEKNDNKIGKNVIIYNGYDNNKSIITDKLETIITQKTFNFNKLKIEDSINYIFIINSYNTKFTSNINNNNKFINIEINNNDLNIKPNYIKNNINDIYSGYLYQNINLYLDNDNDNIEECDFSILL